MLFSRQHTILRAAHGINIMTLTFMDMGRDEHNMVESGMWDTVNFRAEYEMKIRWLKAGYALLCRPDTGYYWAPVVRGEIPLWELVLCENLSMDAQFKCMNFIYFSSLASD